MDRDELDRNDTGVRHKEKTMCEKPVRLDVQINPENGDVVFTTNYEDVYEKLMKFCDEANVSRYEGELNGFHAQCWYSTREKV